MKLINSPIQLIKFNLLNVEYKFITSDSVKKPDLIKLFNSYHIDIDFAWKKNNDHHLVFCKVEINRNDEKFVGYSIFVEGVAIFKIDNNADIATLNQLLKFSGPSIVLQELRGVIRSITSNGPAGVYTLPTIDINQMVAQKIATVKEANKTKIKRKKAK